ncbi:MAG: hypothetical protein RIQ46_517 [Pseudomonadota bacterium]
MTEHTKIPVPEDGDKAPSLIERASGAFGFGSLAPPPVPKDLAAPRRPAPARKAAAPVAMPAEAPVPVAEPAPVATAPQPEPAPAAAAPDVPAKFTGRSCSVDREHLREQGLIVPEGTVTALLEEFRIVKRQLLVQANELKRAGGGHAAQRVLICSPHPSEGKTYCAVNLALSMAAEKESEVLLVDADFAKPSVLSALGLPGGRGLMDALTDPKIDVLDCVIGTDIPGLWVLPAGSATNSDSEYLNSSRTRPVLDRLTQGASHRMVIFDSPPALAASPAAELARYVGQALVVARADRTGQGALEDAISLLSACPNIQLILNAVNFSPSGRKFGSYYGYGG